MKKLAIPIIIILITISIPSSFAQSFTNDTPFGLKLKMFVYDIHEAIIIDQDLKTRVVAQHVEELQQEIDQRVERSEPIPHELEEKRKEKINTAQRLIQAQESVSNADEISSDNADTPLSSVKERLSVLASLSEVNEIRILWSEFPKIINSNNPELKEEYNERVNSLDSWKNNCMGKFNVDNYKPISDSYELLKDDCPALESFDQKRLKALVSAQI